METALTLLLVWNVLLTLVVGFLWWAFDKQAEKLNAFKREVVENVNKVNDRVNVAVRKHGELTVFHNKFVSDMLPFIKRVEQFMED